MYQGTITRRMKSTRSEVYRNLLTRKDFKSKISKLKATQSSQQDTITADLCDMFSALKIPCEVKQDAAYYEALAANSNLPEFHNVAECILKIMYDSFENYPTPEKYILRIVNRLSDVNDEWEENSLRLKILKQFIKYLNCGVYIMPDGKKKSIYGWEKVILEYAEKHGANELTCIADSVEYIDDMIFEEYFKTIESAQSILNKAQNSPELLKIRKEISELKKAKKENKKDKSALQLIEEEIKKRQEALKEEQKKIDSAKSRLKYIRKNYGLVKLADDLSKGIFKAGGATKQDLYLFAIAFNMTYTVNKNANALKTEEIFDYNSDIEKNLFEDYYANNLMRFITSVYEGDLSAFELDPSGVGINYKNFAEMVYIYFISKDYTPIEKLKRATDMIERLKLNAIDHKESDHDSTKYFTDLFTEEILGMNEADFEIFIAENYDCNVEFKYTDKEGKSHTGKKSVLQLQTAQETAFRFYQNLLTQMEKSAADVPPFQRENCNYGLWFVDVSSLKKYGISELEEILKPKDRPDEKSDDSEKIKKFVKLLYGINMFLGHLFIESESELSEEQEHTALSKRLIKKMSVDKPEDMSRTALIVAYYYRYNQLHELRSSEKSFVDVMDDYTDSATGLNSMLEASGYQPINDRNIFDLAVIFSSYAYLSM